MDTKDPLLAMESRAILVVIYTFIESKLISPSVFEPFLLVHGGGETYPGVPDLFHADKILCLDQMCSLIPWPYSQLSMFYTEKREGLGKKITREMP